MIITLTIGKEAVNPAPVSKYGTLFEIDIS
jgi:hypothetical protein